MTRVTVGEWPVPEGGVRLIDLDPAYSVEEQAAVLAEALRRPGREPVAAYRGDQRYVPPSVETAAAPEEKGAQEGSLDLTSLLAAAPFERRALVEGYLRQELSRLLGSAISDEDMEMPVQSLGLDSLMAIQVRNRVETSLGVALSLVDFLKGLRVRQLVDSIVGQLTAAPAPAAKEAPPAAPVEVPSGEVGSLSERELDSLLVSLLDAPGEAR